MKLKLRPGVLWDLHECACSHFRVALKALLFSINFIAQDTQGGVRKAFLPSQTKVSSANATLSIQSTWQVISSHLWKKWDAELQRRQAVISLQEVSPGLSGERKNSKIGIY